MKKHIRIGTAGYIASVENQDILHLLQTQNGIEAGTRTTTIEVIAKADMVVKINGYTSTIFSGSELQVFNEYIDSFVTVTSGVQFGLSVTM